MIVNRICGMCQGGCQVNVTIEDGKSHALNQTKHLQKEESVSAVLLLQNYYTAKIVSPIH